MQTQAVLTLLADANLKNPYSCFNHCVISNFEKKFIVNKTFSQEVFTFSRKGELCKKWNLRAIQSN